MTGASLNGIPIDVTELYTPIASCVGTPTGAVRKDVLEQLEVAGYDQAPVLDDAQRVVALVNTTRLRELFTQALPLSRDDEALYRPVVHAETMVENILDVLASSRAALVVPSGSELPVGLITISDLNRHALRRAVYSVVAELEERLARLIETRFSDFWEWLHKLGEDHQIRLLGYVEVTRRRGVDVGPIAACTLTQLLSVVGAFADLRGRLGSESRTRWDNLVGPIIDLRNRVMHPVRPMVLRHEDVKRLQDATNALVDLCRRARALGAPDLPPTK